MSRCDVFQQECQLVPGLLPMIGCVASAVLMHLQTHAAQTANMLAAQRRAVTAVLSRGQTDNARRPVALVPQTHGCALLLCECCAVRGGNKSQQNGQSLWCHTHLWMRTAGLQMLLTKHCCCANKGQTAR
jgi:hypothetical protein